jgi:hypothetical protein
VLWCLWIASAAGCGSNACYVTCDREYGVTGACIEGQVTEVECVAKMQETCGEEPLDFQWGEGCACDASDEHYCNEIGE